MNQKALLYHAMPPDFACESSTPILSSWPLLSLYRKKKKCSLHRRHTAVVMRRKIIDTSSGVTLTSETALSTFKKCNEGKALKLQPREYRKRKIIEKTEAKERESDQREEAALQKLAGQRAVEN